MIQLILKDVKCLRLNQTENVYAGENKISEFSVVLPEKITQYKTAECEIEMRSFVSEDRYISNRIDTSTRNPKVPITSDLTEKAQIVPIMFFITHEGNVIGKTNFEKLNVLESKDGSTPLDPREELDEIIAELRAKNAAQAQTISSQATTIEAKDGQISELNDEITEKDGQITELNTENARLENLTDTQRGTIQNMLDNPPQPKLYTPPVVTPSGSVQQINPPTGYDGLSSVTVAPVITPEIRLQNKLVEPTSNTQLIEADEGYDGLSSVSVTGTSYMNIDLQKWVNQSPDDEPFEMIFDKAVRSYVAYGQIKMIKATILTATSIGGSAFYGCTALIKVNLPDSLTSIGGNAFYGCTALIKINLPDSLTSIGQYAFQNCSSLTEINLPDSLTIIGANAFQNCTSLTEINLPDSLMSVGGNAFQNCPSLTNLTLAQGFNCSGLNVSASTRFTAETIVACLEALADRTGQRAYTITFGSTNLNKLTNEQKAIATNKNWNLA